MQRLERFSGPLLSLLRMASGLLFLEHGTAKLFTFPATPMFAHPPHAFTLIWFAGLLEFAGGALISLGLFTRAAAFLLSGEMAIAYWTVHAPQGFFPVLNMGEAAILFCFVFLYLSAAGAGPWSLDAALRKTS
jgi:putative oxidoreductase